ncbi:response regulator transcription factor [Brooklawnia sp.]|uniref:response regulator transcription factor n=1 Tax=Brooklawnia sp. TaxID=2699740 RepID=UPI00311EBD62
MKTTGGDDEQVIRVLLVEDDALAQRAVATYLAAADGIELAGVAGDGLDAIRIAGDLDVDVAIVDIHMPRLNGIETTRRLTRAPFNLKVLCFTALASDTLLMDALSAGASGFLLKTDSPELIQFGVRSAHSGDALISPQLVYQVLARTQTHSQPPADLSITDVDLVRLIGYGLTNAQIGEQLGYSVSTVKTYVSRLLTRLDKRNRAEIATLANEWGLIGEHQEPINQS